MVTATAVIADVIPLRERGKYQGALGAVFGVTTVLGPLLGGLLTDHLSWRVDLLHQPAHRHRGHRPGGGSRCRRRGRADDPSIDYLGIVFVSLGAAGLTLALSWGGTAVRVDLADHHRMFVGSLVSLVVFVARRAARHRPDPAAAAVHVVGLQRLRGPRLHRGFRDARRDDVPADLPAVRQGRRRATESGLQTLPMVARPARDLASLSGTVVGRTGRYKIFPVVGVAVMALGPLPAVAARRGHAVLADGPGDARPGPRHRLVHAGADDRRAEHRRPTRTSAWRRRA